MITIGYIVILSGHCSGQSSWIHGPLQPTADGHYLQFKDGMPFFWLGDTGWEMFQRLTKEEVEKYLENRRRKGFTVIQAVALGVFDGLRQPNRYGDLPFRDTDPTQPNEKYFRWIDTVITMAMHKNLFIGLLPAWGDYVVQTAGQGPVIFDAQNAYAYGYWIGKRYAGYPNIIWILGGDKPAVKDNNDYRPVWSAMANGILNATGHTAIVSYHPQGGASSSKDLQQEDWLSINMFQSGHGDGHDVAVWNFVSTDRNYTPVKPTLDGEPNYEDHPVNPWPEWNPANGYFRAYDVRKQLYRAVFAGACGVTYGHHAIWQFCSPAFPKVNHADRYWTEAIDRPGAFQAGYLRSLIESRSVVNRIPDQTMIVAGQGVKGNYMVAFRAADNSYGMIYMPVGKTITVNGLFVAGDKISGWWFNPVNGRSKQTGIRKKTGKMVFTPPSTGTGNDWVLILDNAAHNFAAPGKSIP